MPSLGFFDRTASMTADGTANTTGAAASMLHTSLSQFSIDGNWWAVGKRMKIRAMGRISYVITTPGAARYDVRFGGTVVFDSLAIPLDVNQAVTSILWRLDIDLLCRAVGAAANLFGYGVWNCAGVDQRIAAPPKGNPVATLPWNVSAPAVGANFSSLVAQTFDMFFTQTAATGSHTAHTATVELFNS